MQLELHLDSRPVSQELENYMTELAKYTDKLTVHERVPSAETGASLPFVDVLTESGEQTGLAFHGVPGGHEFTSFILGLYNAAGPGQPLDPVIREKYWQSSITFICRSWYHFPVPCARIL